MCRRRIVAGFGPEIEELWSSQAFGYPIIADDEFGCYIRGLARSSYVVLLYGCPFISP